MTVGCALVCYAILRQPKLPTNYRTKVHSGQQLQYLCWKWSPWGWM